MKGFRTWDPKKEEASVRTIIEELLAANNRDLSRVRFSSEEFGEKITVIKRRYYPVFARAKGKANAKAAVKKVAVDQCKEVIRQLLRLEQTEEDIRKIFVSEDEGKVVITDEGLSAEAKLTSLGIARHFRDALYRCKVDSRRAKPPKGYSTIWAYGNTKANEFCDLVRQLGDTPAGRTQARLLVAPKYRPKFKEGCR